MTLGARILVVDDEQIMRDGCTRILSKEDWEVVTAENGEACLDAIKGGHGFDLVLLDLMMPGISGMKVLETVQQVDADLLVIVITGYATVELAVEAMKKGAYDFIPKPFTPDQLRIVVQRALEKRSLQREMEVLKLEREKSLRDITTEKSRIMSIVNCMGDGVLVCDRDSCVVLTNPAAGRMLGIQGTSLVGKPLSECSLDGTLTETIMESLRPTDPTSATISQELCPFGSPSTYLRAHTAPVKNNLGEMLGAVTVLQDITSLKELDNMKSDFVAMVSHELRSPVALIQQQLSVILKGLSGDLNDKQTRMLTRAKERAIGLLELINDLLDLSKIEAGMAVQYRKPLQLENLLEKVYKSMLPEAEAKGLNLTLQVKHPIPRVNGDRNNLEGVFTNLVNNALKYTPGGGTVTIQAKGEGKNAMVEISDTGIGISQNDLPRIFDRFYRVKSDKTRQIVGTGLGLSIVKQIVEAHLGTISVESEEGGGSTFTVVLPKGTSANQLERGDYDNQPDRGQGSFR
ncbi:MAG: response regulator [Proteobacteria bacterium]|nr:response regulator [Pseudomonadota bacterium]